MGVTAGGARCIALLGGTFNPIHDGHVALGALFRELLQADELRVIPAGQPWQKSGLRTSADDRIAMVRLAFAAQHIAVTIDTREIERLGPTYTVDTLRELRAEAGPDVPLAFLLGADQLGQLDSWRDWQSLFGLAHLCVAARPGFSLGEYDVPERVAQEFARRSATPAQIRATPHGHTYLAQDLAVDVSATQVRQAIAQGVRPIPHVSPVVLDYIEQHHLYKT
ncbi:MAG TPA: nicotinate-nucleotide adenylyltransferase [Burkholderiaceae bacterium]